MAEQQNIIDRNLARAGITDPALASFIRDGLWPTEGGGRETAADGGIIYGPKTRSGERAMGPLQIMPGTFNDVARQTGLKLDPKNNDDLALAGIKYAQQVWDKTGGDPYNAARAYQGGLGILKKSDQISDGNLTNKQYAEKVVAGMGGQTPGRAPTDPTQGIADLSPVAVAGMEINLGLPSGSLLGAQQQAIAQRDQQKDWASALAGLAQKLPTRTDPTGNDDVLSDIARQQQQAEQLDALQEQARRAQDSTLARALGGDEALAQNDRLALPGAVDRYLDRVLTS